MSSKPYFLDSNIWLYVLLYDQDAQDINRKRERAISLTNGERSVVSTQVINEVCVNLLRKAAFSENQIKELIQDFYDRCTVIELNLEILTVASDLRLRYGFSFWDGLIVASALYANLDVLYSEDMQDGLIVYEKMEIVNPFK